MKKTERKNHYDPAAALSYHSPALCSCPRYLSTGKGYRVGLEGWDSLFQKVSWFPLSLHQLTVVNMHLTAAMCKAGTVLGSPRDRNVSPVITVNLLAI